MLCGFEAENGHVWQILITEFPVFPLVSFVAPAPEGVFMSKTAELHIFSYGLRVLVPTPNRLARWIHDLGFSQPFIRQGLTLSGLAHAFRRRPEVDRSCLELGNRFFLYRWCTVEAIGLVDKRVHQHNTPFTCHKPCRD